MWPDAATTGVVPLADRYLARKSITKPPCVRWARKPNKLRGGASSVENRLSPAIALPTHDTGDRAVNASVPVDFVGRYCPVFRRRDRSSTTCATLSLGRNVPRILSGYPQPTSTARNLLYVDTTSRTADARTRPTTGTIGRFGRRLGRDAHRGTRSWRGPGDGCFCTAADNPSGQRGPSPCPASAQSQDLARPAPRARFVWSPLALAVRPERTKGQVRIVVISVQQADTLRVFGEHLRAGHRGRNCA